MLNITCPPLTPLTVTCQDVTGNEGSTYIKGGENEVTTPLFVDIVMLNAVVGLSLKICHTIKKLFFIILLFFINE